ncbi:1-phosphatidylinositol 3-phosphate 5-kinase-like [Patiria miniata]|uniref:1-phosphatidylinositol 3-phosphate 5-kinase n=1 Tax=Patiria miniata TaxID=46514 RepID=A0A913ZA45_PATMI|nr:1-phosphatidylinositol 3-phosphate 5-kinase-like [Patiria miniata]
MDPRAVYEKNSEEISTNIFRGATAGVVPQAQPVMVVENDHSKDKITFFQRLSPDQKSASRFSLPDWFRRSKDTSAPSEKEASTAKGKKKDSLPQPLHSASSLPDLHAKSQQEDKPEPVKKSESGLNASFLAPLAELGQISSRLRIEVPWKQEVTKSAFQSPTRQERPLPQSRLSLPLKPGGSQRSEDSESRSQWESSLGNKQPARSLTTVLRHLSTVVDRSGQVPQDYRDSDFKQYWMPDSQCKECYECGEKFTTLRRRHHCRVCGQIFCSHCCNQEVPGKFMGYTGNLRVCTYCCKIVLSYAQSSIGDLKMLQEDYFTLVAGEMPSSSTTPDIMTPRKKAADPGMPRQRTFSNGSTEGCFDPFELVQTPTPSTLGRSFDSVAQERQHLLKDSAQLHQLWLLIQHPSNGIMFQSHRFRLRTYSDCIVGSELVDWLLLKDKATHRLQAVAIGQALLDAKWLECAASHDRVFHDEYALYRAGKTALSSAQGKDMDISLTAEGELDEIEDRMEPSWFRDINQEDKGDLTDDDGLVKCMPTQSDDAEFVKKHRRATSGGDSIGTWTRGLRPTSDLFTSPSCDKAGVETLQRELSGPWEQEGPVPGLGEVFPNGALSTFGLDQTDLARGPILAHGWLDMDTVSQENGELETLDTLRSTSSKTLVSLAEQQLRAEGLDLSWKDTILPLAQRICSLVKPDVMNGDDMDIRQYVHIKKVPGGTRADCFMVNGTICTKNVAHKKMSGHLSNPRILLLQTAIEHQRVENKFSSIDPIVLQEHEYLKNCVLRIASLKPDILIVEKTVARLAQMFLLHSGITLVLNVKSSVMDRLSRCTEVSVIRSIDQVNQTTPMGHCLMFRLQRYELPKGFSKTLMFFEGCPSHLGCSVVLRGGEHEQLTKVKRVLNLMIYASYHSRLEISFLMDEFAKPPSHSQEADSKTVISPDASSIITPTMGASESISEGLASVQDGLADGVDGDQVDIVSEQAWAEEQELKEEADGGKLGFRATMSSMKKRIQATVASVKAHAHPDAEQELVSSRNGVLDACRDIETSKEATEVDTLERDTQETCLTEDRGGDSTERTEESVEEGKLEPEQMTANRLTKPTPGDYSEQAESSSGLTKPVELSANCDPPAESLMKEANRHSQGSVPEFDHEAMTKEIESKFLEQRRHKLISEDSTSIGSHEDIAIMSPQPVVKTKSHFSTALEEVLLSISPLIKFSLPYLETKAGKESRLRCFFKSKDLYLSPKLYPPSDPKSSEHGDSTTNTVGGDLAYHHHLIYTNVDRCSRTSDAVIIKPPHPLTFSQLTEDAKDETTRSLLADFRARGGRILQRPAVAPHSMQRQLTEAQSNARDSAEMAYRRRLDCLDIYNHQRMLLQFCSYSHLSSNAPNHCVDPWTVNMDFYSSRHDLTLGEFLERYCFSTKYKCPNELCDAEMVDHVRRFVHGNASLHVLLRNLESPIPGFTDKILMWSWCRKCRQVTPVQPMSLDSWHMSFGKYLELRFHCKDYGRRLSALPCGHSLHRHHYQYFGQHNIVASFKYSPILLREVCLPPLPLSIQQAFRSHPASAEEFKNVSAMGAQLLKEILVKIDTLTGMNGANPQAQQYFEQRNAEFTSKHQVDNHKFWQNAKDLQSKITTLASLMSAVDQQPADIVNTQLDIEDSVVSLKHILCQIAFSWNNRFSEFVQQEKERAKKKNSPSVTRQNTPITEKDGPMSISAAAAVRDIDQLSPHAGTPPRSPNRSLPTTPRDNSPSTPLGASLPVTIPQAMWHSVPTPLEVQKEESFGSVDDGTLGSSHSREGSDITAIPPSLAYLDHLGLQKMPNYGISPGLYAGLAYKPPNEPADTVNTDNELLVIEMPAKEDSEPEASLAPATATESAANKEGEDKVAVLLPEGQDQPDATSSRGELPPPSPVKTRQSNSTMKTFFSTLLPGSDLARVEMPYTPNEHHLLPSCTVMPVIIYDQESSSIIAYALSSEQYKTQLYELQQPDFPKPSEGALQPGSNPGSRNTSPTTRRHAFADSTQGTAEGKERPKKGQLTKRSSRGVISFLRSKIPDSPSSASPGSQRKEESHFTYSDTIHYHVTADESTSSFSTENKDETDFEFFKSGMEKRDASSPHIDLQFSDATNTQFFCLVYHADEFLNLRKLVFPAGEETFIRSLSRSITWLAQGGKSRSKFLKTKDDRFVLKQISRLEFQSFKEFAPHYFKYIQQAHAEQRPTTLAKILGVYKVGYHNPITNTAQKQVLLIMENLFYQRRMAQVFDLKGSIRNRHVKTTEKGQQDLVLMDENLLKHMVDSPLFIRSHSKAALTMAVHYDSMFLASHFIMDYSLLVGLDATSDELVVGIIDYIRTFTWDKKLEMMVKSTGIVGGQGKMPTVVSPELYRTRFCEAMDKYFLLVPDRWTNLGQEF